MPMNLDAVGQQWEPAEIRWTSKDVLLYALGVGAGAGDPRAELAFTTENSHATTHRVLPTFAVLLGTARGGPALGDFGRAQMLHAQQTVRVIRPLPADGRARLQARVAGIYDKGTGALAVIESSIFDADTGALMAELESGVFVRGEGGFGGERGGSGSWRAPGRPADHVVTYATREDQALLYRLSGDRNPLHSDPWAAARAGFDRPILHGLCTYGFTGRALLHTLCGSDPAGFGEMSARFAAPVLPGQDLTVRIWDDGADCRFRTEAGGKVVLDRGLFSRAAR